MSSGRTRFSHVLCGRRARLARSPTCPPRRRRPHPSGSSFGPYPPPAPRQGGGRFFLLGLWFVLLGSMAIFSRQRAGVATQPVGGIHCAEGCPSRFCMVRRVDV